MNVEMSSATTKAKPEASETIHRRVLETTIELSRDAYVVQLKDLAGRLGKDRRTVQNHLRLLEAAGRGMFVDHDKEVFALAERIHDLAEQFETQAYLRAGYAAAHRIGWEPEDDDGDL